MAPEVTKSTFLIRFTTTPERAEIRTTEVKGKFREQLKLSTLGVHLQITCANLKLMKASMLILECPEMIHKHSPQFEEMESNVRIQIHIHKN